MSRLHHVQPDQKVTAQPVLFWSCPFPKCPILTVPGLLPCTCQRKQENPGALCLVAFQQPSMAAVFVGSVTPGGVGEKTSHLRGHCSSRVLLARSSAGGGCTASVLFSSTFCDPQVPNSTRSPPMACPPEALLICG